MVAELERRAVAYVCGGRSGGSAEQAESGGSRILESEAILATQRRTLSDLDISSSGRHHGVPFMWLPARVGAGAGVAAGAATSAAVVASLIAASVALILSTAAGAAAGSAASVASFMTALSAAEVAGGGAAAMFGGAVG